MTTSILAYIAAIAVCAATLGISLGIVIGVWWCRRYEHPVIYDIGVTDGSRSARGMSKPPGVSR